MNRSTRPEHQQTIVGIALIVPLAIAAPTSVQADVPVIDVSNRS